MVARSDSSFKASVANARLFRVPVNDLIYLDYQATTPVDPRVVEAMLPYFSERFANPASVQHSLGQRAQRGCRTRSRAGRNAAGRRPTRGHLTSGATEANNLALKGLADAAHRRHIVVLATEHPAVLDTARSLARHGFNLTELAVDSDGQPSLADLEATINDHTLLVSVAAANDEDRDTPPA